MTVQERREKLLNWMRFVKSPITGADAVEKCPAYGLSAGTPRVRSDLRYLEAQGLVRRLRGPDPEGRPHRWEAV
jgi:DeoR/GlpR family transcriptional regulator of sugar metabolism